MDKDDSDSPDQLWLFSLSAGLVVQAFDSLPGRWWGQRFERVCQGLLKSWLNSKLENVH